MARIASIDFGLARLGVAVSDETKMIAASIGVVQAKKTSAETVQEIMKILQPYSIELVIIGFPRHMNGKVGFLADEVTHFSTLLEKQSGLPITLWDERLSSMQAERTLMESGMNRKKRTKFVDALSAVIILQSYLDSKWISVS